MSSTYPQYPQQQSMVAPQYPQQQSTTQMLAPQMSGVRISHQPSMSRIQVPLETSLGGYTQSQSAPMITTTTSPATTTSTHGPITTSMSAPMSTTTAITGPATATTTVTTTQHAYPSMPSGVSMLSPPGIMNSPPISGGVSTQMSPSTVVFKNDYYVSPDSIELVPGDTCGFKTTYDSHHVRTFKAIKAEHTKEKHRHRELSEDRHSSTEDSDYTTTEDCSACTSSTTTHRHGACPKNCKCRCHKNHKESGRVESRHPKHGNRNERHSHRDRSPIDEKRNGGEKRRASSASTCTGYDHVKEIHIHHYHCPDRSHRHGNSSSQNRLPQMADREVNDDWDTSSSSSSSSEDESDYFYRASSPTNRGRKNTKNQQNATLSFKQARGATKSHHRRSSVNKRRASFGDDSDESFNQRRPTKQTEVRHPYNSYRKKNLGVRRDSDSFGVAALPRRRVNK